MSSQAAIAATRVGIVSPQKMSRVDQLAISELIAMLKKRCDAEVYPAGRVPSDGAAILVGSPKSNSILASLVNEGTVKWHPLADQGFQIVSFKKGNVEGVALGGDTPAATLWAVYEYGEQLGIRYTLHDDYYPVQKIAPRLSGLDIHLAPQLKTRGFRILDNTIGTFSGWSEADLKKVVRQLAKLKFNLIQFSIHSTQPFAPFEYQSVKRETAELWGGRKFEITGRAPGRAAFTGARKAVENPDLSASLSPEKRQEAAQRMVTALIDTAHEVGMSADFEFAAAVFPRELNKVVAGGREVVGSNGKTFGPGANAKIDDPVYQAVALAQILGVKKAYPELDSITLRVPDIVIWTEPLEAARQVLQISADALPNPAPPALAAKVVTLAFYEKLMEKYGEQIAPATGRLKLGLGNVPAALARHLWSVPMNVRYTAADLSNVALDNSRKQKLDDSKRIIQPEDRIELSLSSRGIGVLPQNSMSVVASTLQTLASHASGFIAEIWTVAEVDPTVQFLSKYSFDSKVTPKQVYLDFLTALTGNADSAARMTTAFEALDAGTQALVKNAPGIFTPMEGMALSQVKAEKLPAWWKVYNDAAVTWDTECYRANSNCAQHGQRLLFYYAKRSEFMLEYAAAIDQLREVAELKKQAAAESSAPKKKEASDKALETMEKAKESMYNAINHLALQVKDQGDLALIAMLNMYAYKPISDEFQKMQDEAEQK
jgi:hypothetical protein